MNYLDGESPRTGAQNYTQFGAPTRNNLYSSPKTGPTPKDREVECCLPGSLFNCSLLTDTSDCPTMMSQRCASTFDDKCALYADTKAHASMDDYRHFLRDTLRRRFCRLADNSSCVESCTPFDPTAPNGSHLVCKDIGKETLADVGPNSSIDVGLNLPVNISPTFMGNCNLTCDVKSGSAIEAQDPVVSECIRMGFCADILDQICKDTDVAGGSNALLKTYCGVKPAPAAVPAPSANVVPAPSTYPDGADTYTYTYQPLAARASKALSAIRQKLGATQGSSAPTYVDNSSDYSLVWVIVLLAIFYAVVAGLWKLKQKRASMARHH